MQIIGHPPDAILHYAGHNGSSYAAHAHTETRRCKLVRPALFCVPVTKNMMLTSDDTESGDAYAYAYVNPTTFVPLNIKARITMGMNL